MTLEDGLIITWTFPFISIVNVIESIVQHTNPHHYSFFYHNIIHPHIYIYIYIIID